MNILECAEGEDPRIFVTNSVNRVAEVCSEDIREQWEDRDCRVVDILNSYHSLEVKVVYQPRTTLKSFPGLKEETSRTAESFVIPRPDKPKDIKIHVSQLGNTQTKKFSNLGKKIEEIMGIRPAFIVVYHPFFDPNC